MTRRPHSQAGMTLVELMITMTLTALLVGIVFTMLVQLSSAYRSQGKISELQQTLTAAQGTIVRDVRQAGLMIPNGYKVAYDLDFHQSVVITDESDAPDSIVVAYADPSAQAAVTAFGGGTVDVDDAEGFEDGDLAVMVFPRDEVPNQPESQRFDACVVQIATASGTTLTLEETAPWGQGGNGHCSHVLVVNGQTMIYRFQIRGWRIDLTRPELAVLQRSLTGGVEDDWEDMGVGFTDLQVASRWIEPLDGVDTTDDDTDPTRDWYSGGEQELKTAPGGSEPAQFPTEVSISLVVRTTHPVAGISSSQTPTLINGTETDNNEVGNRASVQLEGIPDASRPPELAGNHVYRWATFRVDLRNLGVSM